MRLSGSASGSISACGSQSRDELAALVDESDAVFLGVGLGADRELDCPGTELPGFWQSLELIAALKQGDPPTSATTSS